MQKLAHNGQQERERERERDHCKHFPMNHVGEKICSKKETKKIILKNSVTVQQDSCYYKRIHYQTKNCMNAVKKFPYF